MSLPDEALLNFRPLYQGPIVGVQEYRCRAGRGGPAVEERSDRDTIVLLRHGAFCKHFGRRSVTADVNHAVFFARGSTYRVSHPADCGDRGTVFVLAHRVLLDVIGALDPSVEDRPDRPFPFVTGPCEPGVFWRHRELARRLEDAAAHPLDPLRTDVSTLELVADVLEAAFARHGWPRGRCRRNGTDADHADRAEAAKSYLASRLADRVTLNDVARAVHASPFHLARVFRHRTGVPIHRYLTRLRLRAAVERLWGGAEDLTTLALESGFSSHSHFTGAFRREFGRTPSDVRRALSRRTLGELSKNLEVGIAPRPYDAPTRADRPPAAVAAAGSRSRSAETSP
jgi:AraC-like DNA-binding protein